MKRQFNPFQFGVPKICHESARDAREKLINRELHIVLSDEGDATIGSLGFDFGEYLLKRVNAEGTIGIRGLKAHVSRILDSGADPNRFLIRLGRALERTSGVAASETPRDEAFLLQLVEGWATSIWVDGRHWPPLCLFGPKGLPQFLDLCAVTDARVRPYNTPRTLEKLIERLGLVRIRSNRIKNTEIVRGQYVFS